MPLPQFSLTPDNPLGNRRGWHVGELHARIRSLVAHALEKDLFFTRTLTSRILHAADAAPFTARGADEQAVQAVYDFVSPYRPAGPLHGAVLAPHPLRFEAPGPSHGPPHVVELPASPWRGLRYEPDPRLTHEDPALGTMDLYQSLRRSVETGIGDCASHAIAHASLLKCIGFRCRTNYARIRFRGENGQVGTTWHAVASVGLPRQSPNRWIWLDTTVPYANPGWVPAPGMLASPIDSREV